MDKAKVVATTSSQSGAGKGNGSNSVNFISIIFVNVG